MPGSNDPTLDFYNSLMFKDMKEAISALSSLPPQAAVGEGELPELPLVRADDDINTYAVRWHEWAREVIGKHREAIAQRDAAFQSQAEWKQCALDAEAKIAALDVPKPEEIERLRSSLAMMYDKWENGTACQEASEDGECIDGTNLGNAFKLSMAEEQEILNLIVTEPGPDEQACANCGKPYRAHLLHDHNKCGPNSDGGWFPKSIADAVRLRSLPSEPQDGNRKAVENG